MVSDSVRQSKTISEVFLKRVVESADKVAYEIESGERWIPTTWPEYGEQVKYAALGLLSIGIQRGERIAVWGETTPEWTILDLAVMSLGGCTAGIYQTNTPDQAAYIINDSAAVLIAVDHRGRIDSARAILPKTPSVRHLLTWGPAEAHAGDDAITFEGLISRGKAYAVDHPTAYEDSVAALTPDTTAVLVYTSGTTGPPKGARLSHRNCLFCCRGCHERLDLGGDSSNVAFLPLSHVAEHVVGFLNRIYSGGKAYFLLDMTRFAEVAKLKGPSVMGAVPRVYEKIYAAIQEKVKNVPPKKAALFRWALRVGSEAAAYRMQGQPIPVRVAAKLKIADRLVLSKLRAVLGGNVKFMICGAAPISKDIIDFWNSVGIPFYEVYGMTESTGISHINYRGNYKAGTVGTPMPGYECRIAPDGEILVRGEGVFQGYLNMPEATAEAIDAEGWLHTGDIGEMDADGFLRITDRKKNLIVTAGGKNVAPANIELLITREPLISQVIVIGDRRRFLSALITLSAEHLVALQANGTYNGLSAAEIAASDAVRERVQAAIDRANVELARYENIRKYEILEREFSIDSGEMTPTLKLKRKVIETNHAHIIEAFYEETISELI
jgi:long-chain acyl-CoA synthetase